MSAVNDPGPVVCVPCRQGKHRKCRHDVIVHPDEPANTRRGELVLMMASCACHCRLGPQMTLPCDG